MTVVTATVNVSAPISLNASSPAVQSYIVFIALYNTASTSSNVNTVTTAVGYGIPFGAGSPSMRSVVNSVEVNTTSVILIPPDFEESTVNIYGINRLTNEPEGPNERILSRSVLDYHNIIPQLIKVGNDVTRLPHDSRDAWSQNVLSDLNRIRATEVVKSMSNNYQGQATVQDRLATREPGDNGFDSDFLVNL